MNFIDQHIDNKISNISYEMAVIIDWDSIFDTVDDAQKCMDIIYPELTRRDIKDGEYIDAASLLRIIKTEYYDDSITPVYILLRSLRTDFLANSTIERILIRMRTQY